MKRRCFVVMPFKPELNFVYLYLAQYLEQRHNLVVTRGDTEVLTKPLMDKIAAAIAAADVIIGDVTESNANVFFELGLAHAAGKPIIFLTRHDPEAAPVDIRQFEHIQYDLAKHRELLERLDNAIENLFRDQYQRLYERGLAILTEFKRSTGVQCRAFTLDEFRLRVIRAKREGEQPDENAPEERHSRFLLPRIADSDDLDVRNRLYEWLRQRYPAQP